MKNGTFSEVAITIILLNSPNSCQERASAPPPANSPENDDPSCTERQSSNYPLKTGHWDSGRFWLYRWFGGSTRKNVLLLHWDFGTQLSGERSPTPKTILISRGNQGKGISSRLRSKNKNKKLIIRTSVSVPSSSLFPNSGISNFSWERSLPHQCSKSHDVVSLASVPAAFENREDSLFRLVTRLREVMMFSSPIQIVANFAGHHAGTDEVAGV